MSKVTTGRRSFRVGYLDDDGNECYEYLEFVLADVSDELLQTCQDVLLYLESDEGNAPNGWRMITALEALRQAITNSTQQGEV